MRITLHFKVFLGYLIYGLLGFLVISMFSSETILNYLIRDKASVLYDDANVLAASCRESYAELNAGSLRERFDSLEAYLDASIWVVKTNGTVVYASDKTVEGLTLTNFSAAAKGNDIYYLDDFYGTYDAPVMTVMAPITGNFSTYGYIVLHLPLSSIQNTQLQIMRVIYITFGVIFVLSLLILLIFELWIYRPIRKITAAAKEYAAGNLTYELKLKSDDEIGYLSRTLSSMANDLSTKEADQKKFISNVSHDFRSPLTSIKGYLEAMLDGTIPPELHEKYMKRVISETERLTKLTSSTLAMQTLDAHGNLLDITSFDINQVIRDSAASFEVTCLEKNIQFDLIFANKSALVSADKNKIQQVIYNLIDNAIKFSNPSSTIWIETYERTNKIFVSVKDQGCGIPRESQKKIWERFYKSDSSRGKDRTGTGLGLSITKEIITAHKEHIDVISTEGIGTEFIFTLPKARP